MSSRRNFLDADNSIMERNLRFVKNDLEENINQYFGGSGSRGNNSTVNVPPRDYKVVQPKPAFNNKDGSHARTQLNGLEIRRAFLLKLGLARHEAYELAKSTNFDVNHFEQKLLQWRDNGVKLDEITKRILYDIRNENSRNEEIEREYEKTSLIPKPVPLMSISFENPDALKRNHMECNEIPGNFSPHNRSVSGPYDRPWNDLKKETQDNFNRNRIEYDEVCRKRSPCNRSYDRPWNDLRDESYQLIRRFSPEHERKGEEHFSLDSNFRNEVQGNIVGRRSRSRSYSPPRINHGDQRYNSLRSRSPNGYNNTVDERRDEEYFKLRNNYRDDLRENLIRKEYRSYSPFDLKQGRSTLSRSRSPHRVLGEEQSGDYTAQRFSDDQYPDRRYTPPKNYNRQEHFIASRSVSPNRRLDQFRKRSSERCVEQGNFWENVNRDTVYDRSPPRHELGEHEHSKSLRSRSPTKRNSTEYFSQRGSFRETISERCRSPPRYDRNEQFYRSSRSRSPNESFNLARERLNDYFSVQKSLNFRDDVKRDTATQNREVPSLLSMNVFPTKTSKFKRNSPNRNVPSLLTLKVNPNLNDFDGPSTSAKGSRYNQEFNKKNLQYPEDKRPSKFQNQRNTQEINNKPVLRQLKASIPIIQSGLKKPPPGYLKADPVDYWTQWWPNYKYIEYSTPKVNPNDIEIKTCINFMFKRHDPGFRRRINLLLSKGVKSILSVANINEVNYYVRDIYRLFKYKKHLEDPNFLNVLTPQELNRVAPALRQFKIRSNMAFLHQALICKWHTSLDIIKKSRTGEPIMSNYARVLLNDKCFHYLTMESIQELKIMCQNDWPQFDEFYKNITAKKIDIYSFGVGPNTTVNNSNFVYKHDDEDEDDMIY